MLKDRLSWQVFMFRNHCFPCWYCAYDAAIQNVFLQLSYGSIHANEDSEFLNWAWFSQFWISGFFSICLFQTYLSTFRIFRFCDVLLYDDALKWWLLSQITSFILKLPSICATYQKYAGEIFTLVQSLWSFVICALLLT